MSDPETRMVAKLDATTAVTDLVSTRIRPVQLNDEDALPGIVYQRVGTESVNHSTGECDHAYATVQVTCIASTYPGAKALGAAVKACLSGWTDSGGTPVVAMCHWQGDTDIPQGIEAGQDTQLYAVAHDFLIHYET